MAAASRRFCALAAVVAWGVSCLPALAQPPRVELLPPEATVAAVRAGVLQPLSGEAFRLTVRAPGHTLNVRAADLDADGDLDLVTLGASGVRTWINTGNGRFIEQSAARTIVRAATGPSLVATQATPRAGDAAVSVERPVAPVRVATTAATRDRRVTGDAAPSSISSRVPTTGGSRAPPASRT